MQTEILIFDGIDDLDAFGPYAVLAEAGFDVTRLIRNRRRRDPASTGISR
jgi:putative intracellular protease/amidase